MGGEPRRPRGFFREALSVAGGVAFVSKVMLAAVSLFRDAYPLIGGAWILVVIVMFRWYYRDE